MLSRALEYSRNRLREWQFYLLPSSLHGVFFRQRIERYTTTTESRHQNLFARIFLRLDVMSYPTWLFHYDENRGKWYLSKLVCFAQLTHCAYVLPIFVYPTHV